MHHNSIQGMVHETLTLGCSAREATYLAILQDGVSEAEHKAMTCRLCSEADAAWKEMHEVMYNHQLQYEWQLSTFLTDMEMTLNNMRTKYGLLSMPWQRMRASRSMPAWVSHCKYSTCSRRHLIPDTDTPHHCLLPGILHLQKMVPRARRCFTSPQGSQGIPHSVQSPGWGHLPTK